MKDDLGSADILSALCALCGQDVRAPKQHKHPHAKTHKTGGVTHCKKDPLSSEAMGLAKKNVLLAITKIPGLADFKNLKSRK